MFHVPFNRSALAYPTVQKNVTAAKRSDGALVFKQGFITYTIQGDRRLKGEDYWYDSDAKTKGSINAK
jgi:hypothetical protein